MEKDYAYDDGFYTEGISISKALTIDGKGHTINGLSKSRIFYGDSKDIIIFENIVFMNGYSNGDGGAIYIDQDTIFGQPVIFHGCDFVGNRAEDSGGAIYAYNGAWLSLTNCVFKDNVASYTGGAFNTDYADLNGCRFVNNSAKSGGAMYLNNANIKTLISQVIMEQKMAVQYIHMI